jgi:GxxExxY protein
MGGEIIYKDLSYKIVGVLYEVYNQLGYGYQEKYYERAIELLFLENKILFKRQVPYRIWMRNQMIGRYYFDFLVEDKIILEIKKGNYFSRRNIEQVKGYLKVANLKLAILANFTTHDVKFKRVLNLY